MEIINKDIESTLSISEIIGRLAPTVHPGIFYPGRHWVGFRQGWLYEGKVADSEFTIRRITPYKWLYPMLIGRLVMDNGQTVIHLQIDSSHFKHMYWFTFSAAFSIALAVGMALIFGRDGGASMMSSYLYPALIVGSAVVFILVIKGITRTRYERDVRFLKEVASPTGKLPKRIDHSVT